MNPSVSFRLRGAFLLTFAFTTGTLSAQTSAGALVGLVRDTAGAAIPQAVVTVTNTQTNVTSRLVTAYRKDLERGLASYDQTRRFITSLLCEFPFGKGKRWLSSGSLVNAILGGWQANTILTLADGLPFTVSRYCGDRAQVGNDRNVERMNVVSDPLPSGFQKTIYQQFDASAFKTPALGTLGTVGRNTLRGPGQRAVDFSLFKNFRFRERFETQFRAEAFNVIASPYYTNIYPGFNASATDFGSLVPVGGDKGNLFSPRIYQMALRFMF